MPLNFTDMLLETLANRPVDKSFATLLPYNNWLFNDVLMQDDKKVVAGGTTHEFSIAYRVGTSTHWVKPAAVRNPVLTNYMVKAQLALVNTYYEVAYVEEEMLVNRDSPDAMAQQIVNIINVKRQQEKLGHMKALEDVLFAVPVTTGDNLTPHGIPYHIPPITAAQISTGTGEGAFQGQLAMTNESSSGTTWQNIDRSSSTYSLLRTWNAEWADSTVNIAIGDDNRYRLAKAWLNLNFDSPIGIDQIKTPMFNRFRQITDQYTWLKLGAAAQAQNDNLGSDVLKYMGVNLTTKDSAVFVNGLPVRWAQVLDTESATYRGYHPFYFLNLDHLKVAYDPRRWFMQRKPASDAVHQPDVVVEYVDTKFNLICTNPQQVGGVISWIS